MQASVAPCSCLSGGFRLGQEAQEVACSPICAIIVGGSNVAFSKQLKAAGIGKIKEACPGIKLTTAPEG